MSTTSFSDTATSTIKTFTYTAEQDRLKIVNTGPTDLFFNVGRYTNVVLHPSQTWENNVDFKAFDIRTREGSCTFDATLTVDGSTPATLADLDTYTPPNVTPLTEFESYKAENTTEILTVNGRIDSIIVTPAEGITEQEIIDARQGESSLGAKIGLIVADLNADVPLEKLKGSEVIESEDVYTLISGTITAGKYARGAIGVTLIQSTSADLFFGMFDVSEGDIYYISTYYNYDELYKIPVVFVDVNNLIIVREQLGITTSTMTSVDRYEVTVPENAVKMYVNCLLTSQSTQYAVETKAVVVNKATNTLLVISKDNLDADLLSKNSHKPVILFNFDAPTNFVTDGRWALMQKYNMPCTLNVTIEADGSVGYPDIQFGLNHIDDLIKSGVDFAIYSKYLKPLPEDSATYNSTDPTVIAQFETYVGTAKTLAETKGIFNPTAWFARFMQTGTAMNQALINLGFKICRGYKVGIVGENTAKDILPENFNPLDATKFNVNPVGIHTDDVALVIGYIDTAIANGHDFAPFAHGLYPDVATAIANYGIIPQNLEDVLQHVRTKIDNGECEAMTFREYYKSLYPTDGERNDYCRLLKYAKFDV